jgi:RHS repeat-associated protein
MTMTYEPTFNQLASITDPLDHTIHYDFDPSDNSVVVRDALDHQTKFTFNSKGQLTSRTDPLLHVTQLLYEGPDLAHFVDPLNRVTSLYTDSAGRLVKIADPAGNRTRFEYNAFNQIKKIIEHSGATSEITYDGNGNPLSIKDARNQTTSYTYDNMDRVISRTDGLQGATSTETFEYDVAGNAVKLIDRRGKVTTINYDNLDRPAFIGYGVTAGPAYESTSAYTYDFYDRVTQVVDSIAGTINISFDDLARTASETSPQGTIGFTYDKVGRVIAKNVSGQPTISYGYDNANRLLNITQGLANVGFTYDDANRRSTLTLPNGIVVDSTFDDASQLTGLTYRNGPTLLGDLTYAYDKSGRRTSIGGSLAQTALPQAMNGPTYNAANRLTQKGSTTLTYDANGNLTNDGNNTYTWDARNQLVGISGAVAASFQYDAFGRRVRTTINGATKDYLYDGVNVVQEKVGGSPTANMLTGDVDEIFSRTESATQSVLADGLGSTLSLLDSAGVAQTNYTYEPFGNTTLSGNASSNPSQYTGRDNDGTGLYYYRARYYSPTLQRFISEDPIDFAGGDTNLYAYVGNSPCNLTDPSGTNPLLAACVGGAIFGAAFDAALNTLAGRKITLSGLFGSAVAGCIGALVGFGLGRALRFALGGLRRGGSNVVYQALNGAGEVNYVGITNNLERRAAEHLASPRGLQINPIPGLSNLSRADARAVEQVLIETHGLAKNGGTLLNKINSIGSTNPIYREAIRRGTEILRRSGY